MRPLIATCVLFLGLGACAVPSRIVDPKDHSELPFSQLVDELASADVVVLGEIHDNADVHKTHLEIVKALAKKRPLVLSMEMFERDVQTALYQYLSGAMTETEFLASSRPWPRYKTDYRPLVEFARQNGILVVAANVPRSLAAEVAKEGLAAAAGNPDAAAVVSAPKDEYWTKFQEEMGSHAGTGADEKMQRYYEAQCLKDDTMAESILAALQGQRERTPDAVLVHVCGKFHSDFRLGTVARVLTRAPKWKVAVLSAEAVPEPVDSKLRVESGVADYVVVVRGIAEAEAKTPPATGEGKLPPQHPPVAAGTGETAAPSPHAAGGRPALGFLPDYESEGGVGVAQLRDGGPAAKAGMQVGDVIVGLGKVEVTDVASYTAALNELEVGSEVDVLVMRDGKVQQLHLVVGSR